MEFLLFGFFVLIGIGIIGAVLGTLVYLVANKLCSKDVSFVTRLGIGVLSNVGMLLLGW